MVAQTPAEIEESKLVHAAELQLQRINTIVDAAMKPWKRAVRWLTGIVIALAIGAGVSGYLYTQQEALTHQVQSQAQIIQSGAITGCEQQNISNANDVANWDYFIGILAKGDTKPADLREVQVIEHHIAAVDAPRNCEAIYGKP